MKTVLKSGTQNLPTGFSILVSGLVIFLLFSQSLYGASAGCSATLSSMGVSGDGSLGDPFQVDSFSVLNTISPNPDCWGYHYKLTADIDASDSNDGGSGFNPIGNLSPYFTGTFDGDGHTISGLYVNRSGSGNNGLFGYLDSVDAEIKDLGLIDVDITGGIHTGCLVGDLYRGSVTNCYCTGSVSGTHDVGGFIGSIYENGSISQSYTQADVSASGNSVGGFVGINSEGTISQSFSTGDVTSTGDRVGGFAGYSFGGKIENSYSWGDVSGSDYVGGFIGQIYESTGMFISKAYSIGTVTGSSNVGGFLGSQAGTSFADSLSFYDLETSGQTQGAGNPSENTEWIIDKTTSEMQTKSTFSSASWDVETVWNVFSGGYPRLRWEGLTDLSLSFSGSLDYVMPSDELILTVTISNDADGNTASDVILSSTLPDEIAGVQYSMDDGTTWSDWTGSSNIGDLDAGSSREVRLKGTIAATLSGALSFSLSVDFSGTDADTSNNSSNLSIEANLNAPTAPTLLSPTNGATGISTNPVFGWNPSVDSDGDPITYSIEVCQNADLSGCDPVTVEASSQTIFSFSGFGTGATIILLALAGIFWLKTRRSIGRLIIPAIVLGILVVNCAGGGSSGGSDSTGDATSDATGDIGYTSPTTLSPGTTYYWQVTADDGKHGVSASDTWSFTTAEE